MSSPPPSTGQAPDAREGNEFFLNVPEKLDNPFPDLRYFREHRPVFYYPPLDAWFLFAYDDVSTFLHDDRLSADRMKGFVDRSPEEVRDELRRVAPYLETFMLLKDGSEHGRVRSHMLPGLTPAVVHRLAGPIRRCADELLDGARGRLDAADEYAFLLPAYVLSDLFGVRKEDRGRLVQWSVDFIDFFNVFPITVDTSTRMTRSAFAMIEYTRELLAGQQSDFLRAVSATPAAEGGLTDDEIVGNVMLILLAGHIDVRNLIGNVLYLLLTHPDQFARLRAEPALLTGAIEETLRYEPPLTLLPRIATVDFELHGHAIRKGQVVQMSLASANRDAAHFPDPERFDITRPPGKHLSFGAGPHGCFGAALARQMAHVAVATLLERAPGLRLDEGRPIRWYRNAANRGPINLSVAWDV